MLLIGLSLFYHGMYHNQTRICCPRSLISNFNIHILAQFFSQIIFFILFNYLFANKQLQLIGFINAISNHMCVFFQSKVYLKFLCSPSFMAPSKYFVADFYITQSIIEQICSTRIYGHYIL